MQTQSDEEVITELVKIKGVGRWTAEMFLTFTLGRSDIYSAGDYGLKKPVCKLYGLEMTIKPKELIEISNQGHHIDHLPQEFYGNLSKLSSLYLLIYIFSAYML